ncbi:unnamed protein product [Calypogeia fissa]
MGKNNWQTSQGENDLPGLDSERAALCMDFLDRYHRADIEDVMLAEDGIAHYSLVIEFVDLYDANPELCCMLYEQPTKLLQNFDDGARELQERMYNDVKGKGNICLKENVHVRVSVEGLPLDHPQMHPSISQVRVKDVGRLLTIHGTVIRSGGIKMLDGEKIYECTKCKHRFKMSTDLEMGNSIQLPSVCPSERAEACDGVKFREADAETRVHDYQEIKLQESMQALGVGTVPRSIAVVLDDDLVDTIQAGDDIEVTGVLFCKWRNPVKDVRCDLVLTLRANFIRKSNKLKSSIITTDNDVRQFAQFWAEFRTNPLKGRNLILQGICPQVFGLFTVKLAVALTLIGGVQRVNSSGGRVRGESHLLLVGDPGTGKSQFLKYAVKLSHRPVLTTGLGSTSAGLTVTAVKDGGEWVLEAGALVLADGGLCCIDEFDSIREPDRATIHEAMEQQTISVAKAGLVRTLNTRTTVFGVTNPKGQYDPYQSLTVNTSLSGPLLSRFDIVLVLMDTKNPQWDEIVSTHILKEHSKPTQSSDKSNLSCFWTLQMLRSYIQHVRTEFMPVLTTDAEKIIMCYYQLQRRSAVENSARTTVRMLESLIRLAQAHARLMFRKEVLQADAIAAVICVESSMTTSAILDNVGNALHSTFAENPDQEYAKQEQVILAALKLDKDDNAAAVSEDRPDQNTTPYERVSAGGQPLGKESNCVTLTTRKRGLENPPSLDDRGGATTSDAQEVGDVPLPSSTRHGGGQSQRPPLKQARHTHSTHNILAKLAMGNREKTNKSSAAGSVEAANRATTPRLSEELILSTQYSLP